MKKNIYFLTGKRGGFDAMKPLLMKLLKDKSINLKIIVTDQHLMKKFGNTSALVKKYFRKSVIKIKTNQQNDKNFNRNNAMGNLQIKLSKLFKKKIDLFLIYGDRMESLIAAQSCLNFSIPVAHFQGGDISGNIDDKIRYSISQLSNYHFVSNARCAQRLCKIGISKKNIFNVGDNHVDSLMQIKIRKKNYYLRKYNIKHNKDYVLFLLHPDGLNSEKNKKNSDVVLELLSKYKSLEKVCIYPCTDIGYQGIITSINKFKNNKSFHIFPNLIYKDFIGLLYHSRFLIGNSSSGIIECPYLGVSVLNLGNRQIGREQDNNIFNSNFKKKEIIRQIEKILLTKNKKNKNKLLYGDGKSFIKTYKIMKTKILKKY